MIIEDYYEILDFACNEIAANTTIQYDLFDFIMNVCTFLGYIASC